MTPVVCPDRLKIELRMRHDSSQSGIWRIYGEELEDLGTVKGRYCDIVDYALTLPAFIGYGSGGKIELLKIKTINPEDIKRKLDLQNEQKRLKALLEEVDKELDNL